MIPSSEELFDDTPSVITTTSSVGGSDLSSSLGNDSMHSTSLAALESHPEEIVLQEQSMVEQDEEQQQEQELVLALEQEQSSTAIDVAII